jgi:hypothetical protein
VDIQTALVCVVAGLAVLYLGWSAWRTWSSKGCGGCGCGAKKKQEGPTLISAESLSARIRGADRERR